MAIGNFGGARKKPAAPKKSRYAGIQAAAPRDPIPQPGAYRLRVLECEETSNPRTGDWFRTTFEVVDTEVAEHPIGSRVAMINQVSGSGAASGLARVKSFVMSAAGFEDESEYDTFDPEGGFIDSLVGAANEYSKEGHTIINRLVDCLVSRGNATKDGSDFYRNFTFAVVPDEEQK
jgi:hypothetical protein